MIKWFDWPPVQSIWWGSCIGEAGVRKIRLFFKKFENRPDSADMTQGPGQILRKPEGVQGS